MEHFQRRVIEIICLCFVLCIFVFSSPALSQNKNIRFKHLSIKDGLSQVTVNCILQDKHGFMWFGTQDGLNRYDGYEFKLYKHDIKDDSTISDNDIWTLYEDREGIIWIGTFSGGLNQFNPWNESFTRFKSSNENTLSLSDNVSDNDIRAIYEDRDNVVWIGTEGGGLNKFDRKTRKFTPYQHNPNKSNTLSNNDITSICEDKYGTLWVGTNGGGLNKFDKNAEFFYSYKNDSSNSNSLSNNNVTCIYEDKYGTLWIGTNGGGLNKFDKKTEFFTSYQNAPSNSNSLSSNKVTCIYEDKGGTLWIGTSYDGVNRFNRKDNNFTSYKNNPSISTTLSTNEIRCICNDNSGLLWIGTRTAGLNIYAPYTSSFELYQHEINNDKSLSNNDVRAFCEESDDVMWIGTLGGGLNKFEKKTGKFYPYKHDPENPYSLSHDFVRVIYKDKFGALWIGTEGGGLNKLIDTTGGGLFKRYNNNPQDEDSLSHNDVWVIFEDSFNKLWIGTSGGLDEFDRETEKFHHNKNKPDDPNSLSHNTVRCIYEDRNKVLWIGTRGGGLNKFDRANRNFFCYRNKPIDMNSLSHNEVWCIHEDTEGMLWIGTSVGLNKFDRENNKFVAFVTKNGLPNELIYGILEDDQSNLWMSTNKGISKFNLETKTFENYDVEDGLQNNEFNSGSYFKSKEGEMFFGGVNGFNSFFPGQIKAHPYVPPIVITDFLIANHPVELQRVDKDSPLSRPIYATNSLSLSYKQNFFSFEFAALDFASPKKNRYHYKMEGWDKDWINTDSKNRRATYTNLPAADYTFRVKGSGKDGVWNEEGSSIRVRILPPPLLTWWAYTLYVFVVVAILYLIWSAWSKRFLKKKVEEQTIELKKTQSQLVQSEKMVALGILVAGVAHEINNPASFTHTTAYNLQRDIEKLKVFLLELAGDDTDHEILTTFDEKFSVIFSHLAAINEGTTRIAKTVSDLRTFSRIGKGEMIRIKLLEGLQVTENLVKTHYKDQVDFVNDFQADPEIEGNAAELNQVFMNIMLNACQAIIEKQKIASQEIMGNLTIQSLVENDKAVIRFIDDGIGMSQEVRNKMFDPFFTTRSMGEGTGLGLFISYGIIKKHNGRFEVVSEEGKGTTVTLYLPLKSKNTEDKNEES